MRSPGIMLRKLGSLVLVLGLSLTPAVAMADVAGPSGSGGSGGSAGSGGSGGDGEGGKQQSGGGCITAAPGAASGSAALLTGLGILLAIPAIRGRRSKKSK